jgi:D-arabinose 1-dehydrogenase-like Zn-dependent alcohol dehydrogenase
MGILTNGTTLLANLNQQRMAEDGVDLSSGCATGESRPKACTDPNFFSVSLADLITKRIRIIGSQQNGPEYLYEALDFVAQGKVKTIVETYPLAEAAKAYERVAEGRARFRAVLVM